MKILMTVFAALAISTAVNAQQSECTIRSGQDISSRTYDAIVRTVFTGDGVNIVNRRTGEVLDFIAITENSFGVRCRPASAGSSTSENSGSTSSGTTSQTNTVRNSTSVRRTSSSGTTSSNTSNNGSRRGFPASAALGLP
ncbi:hypothetical protein ACKGJY_07500 [Hyunsoonleella sp. 2307UL5-6]|uniref:hypothetical protein n=1 Tax=Hyunsoonleella sp. 2307UL5-6 TaxID=3384768 RepID=UPI0039BCB013